MHIALKIWQVRVENNKEDKLKRDVSACCSFILAWETFHGDNTKRIRQKSLLLSLLLHKDWVSPWSAA